MFNNHLHTSHFTNSYQIMFTSQPHQEAKDTQLSCHQAAGGDLRDERSGARSLLKTRDESPPSLPHLPRHPYTIGMRLWKWGSGTRQYGLRFTGWEIVQDELVYLTHHDCLSYGRKRTSVTPFWEKQRDHYADQTQTIEKSAASLGSRLET